MNTTPEREAFKQRLKERQQRLLKPDAAEPPEAKPTATEVPSAKTEDKRALPSAPKPQLKLVPAPVDFYLGLESKPTYKGLGSVFPSRKKESARAVFVTLFLERPVVVEALARSDMTTLRFLACVLLSEWLLKSGYAKQPDITELWKAIVIQLGGEPPHWTNATYWGCCLADHELTAKIAAPSDKAVLWFSVTAELPCPATIWPWEPSLPRPEKKEKKAATPEGEKS